MSRVGEEWDALNRRWKPVDYLNLSDEALQARRDDADDRLGELEAQMKAFVPEAEAMSLLHKGMEELQDLLVKLAKKAPEALLKAATGI